MDDLEKLRKHIDQIDSQIIKLLDERFSIVKEIGSLKKQMYLPILDDKRKEKLLHIKKRLARETKISEKFIEKIFTIIHDEAVKLQQKL